MHASKWHSLSHCIVSGHLVDSSEDVAPLSECPIITSQGDRADSCVRLPD